MLFECFDGEILDLSRGSKDFIVSWMQQIWVFDINAM